MIEETGHDAVLTAEAIGSWLSGSPLETALQLLYADADLKTSVAGWADRRLVTEFFFLRTPLDPPIVEALAGLPQRGIAGPWRVQAVSDRTSASKKGWRANTLAGLYDAVRLVLAEHWSARAEELEKERSSGPFIANLRVLSIVELDSVPVLPDPGAPTERMFTMPARANAWERLAASRYAFGRLYNRLISPPHPFDFLRLLLDKPIAREVGLWESSAFAAGYDPGLRLEAARDSRKECTLRNSVMQAAPGVAAERSLSMRQVSGSPGSPGCGSGRIWHCASAQEAPEGPLILVVEEWNSIAAGLMKRASGYVETAGGRGSCGTLSALEWGIPSISEARQAAFLPQAVPALLDGDTGILTLPLTGR